jgi:hypothetical protein
MDYFTSDTEKLVIENNVKAAIARRQLGTAMELFLADDDPVSVHCLACGGAEIADYLAKLAGQKTFSQHALEVHPDMKVSELVKLRNQYWNAMKHATTRDGKIREDGELLANFDDEQNDHVLFLGWYDYASAVGVLPIEAQAFQAWYFANFPEKLAEEYPAAKFTELFPGVLDMDRSAKKRLLKKRISWAKRQRAIMADNRTDRRKLVLGRLAAPLPTL